MRIAAKDWSLEMYNEKNRMMGGALKRDIPTLMRQPHGAMPNITPSPARDISMNEHGGIQSRRRCDGTLRESRDEMQKKSCTDGLLRNSEGGMMPQKGCADGICGGWGIAGNPLAMVYSPCQAWRGAYTPDVALARGTLFSELDLPFEPSKCRKGGIC